jgi:hypothetical protein
VEKNAQVKIPVVFSGGRSCVFRLSVAAVPFKIMTTAGEFGRWKMTTELSLGRLMQPQNTCCHPK